MAEFTKPLMILILFLFGFPHILGATSVLPEPVIPHDTHNSVCYGPIHNYRFRPACPDNNSVIAVQNVYVGAKPLGNGCPRSVTEWTNHTGSYLVDAEDTSSVVNVTECCLPDKENDCISSYSYTDSGIPYEYHKSTSGYSASQTNLEVAWQRSTCNDSTNHLVGTNYMYMNYSCIERSKIGDLCSNSIYTVTDGAFYLQNTGYPSSVSSDIDFCQCNMKSNRSSIYLYSIDIRLDKYGDNCTQMVTITDSGNTTIWDCHSAPYFNVTKQKRSKELTVTFNNSLSVDGGFIWIGVIGEDSGPIQIECSYNAGDIDRMTTPSLKNNLTHYTEVVSTGAHTGGHNKTTADTHSGISSEATTPSLGTNSSRFSVTTADTHSGISSEATTPSLGTNSSRFSVTTADTHSGISSEATTPSLGTNSSRFSVTTSSTTTTTSVGTHTDGYSENITPTAGTQPNETLGTILSTVGTHMTGYSGPTTPSTSSKDDHTEHTIGTTETPIRESPETTTFTANSQGSSARTTSTTSTHTKRTSTGTSTSNEGMHTTLHHETASPGTGTNAPDNYSTMTSKRYTTDEATVTAAATDTVKETFGGTLVIILVSLVSLLIAVFTLCLVCVIWRLLIQRVLNENHVGPDPENVEEVPNSNHYRGIMLTPEVNANPAVLRENDESPDPESIIPPEEDVTHRNNNQSACAGNSNPAFHPFGSQVLHENRVGPDPENVEEVPNSNHYRGITLILEENANPALSPNGSQVMHEDITPTIDDVTNENNNEIATTSSSEYCIVTRDITHDPSSHCVSSPFSHRWKREDITSAGIINESRQTYNSGHTKTDQHGRRNRKRKRLIRKIRSRGGTLEPDRDGSIRRKLDVRINKSRSDAGSPRLQRRGKGTRHSNNPMARLINFKSCQGTFNIDTYTSIKKKTTVDY